MPEDWEGSPLRKDYPVQIRRPAYASEALQVTDTLGSNVQLMPQELATRVTFGSG